MLFNRKVHLFPANPVMGRQEVGLKPIPTLIVHQSITASNKKFKIWTMHGERVLSANRANTDLIYWTVCLC